MLSRLKRPLNGTGVSAGVKLPQDTLADRAEEKAKEMAKEMLVMCEQCANPIPYEHSFDMSCARCGHHMHDWRQKSTMRTLAFSLSALILYFPALMFPFMTMEINGEKSSSTIWQGVQTLVKDGSIFIALIVLLASIIIPIIKLVILFYLGLSSASNSNARFKTLLFRTVESVGRWSMLDIFLLAVLVAIMKIAPWTAVKPEIGAVMFALVVIFTMLASASFDSRLLWKDKHAEKN